MNFTVASQCKCHVMTISLCNNVAKWNGMVVDHQSVCSIGVGLDSYFKLQFHSVLIQGCTIEEDFPIDRYGFIALYMSMLHKLGSNTFHSNWLIFQTLLEYRSDSCTPHALRTSLLATDFWNICDSGLAITSLSYFNIQKLVLSGQGTFHGLRLFTGLSMTDLSSVDKYCSCRCSSLQKHFTSAVAQ